MPARLAARLVAPSLLAAASVALAAGFALAQSTAPTTAPAGAADLSSRTIAARVVQASGGDVWPGDVRRLRFTFNVAKAGKTVVTAAHDWDVVAGRDTITWNGKTVTVDVTVAPPALADVPEREAFFRWTNDSYWLLAPLKLLDAGVSLSPAAVTRDLPPSRATMTLSFDGVGLTPGDQYDLAIDLATNRVTHWTYRPNPDKSVGASWDGYEEFNGLTLSTDHAFDDGDTRLFFTDVSVERR